MTGPRILLVLLILVAGVWLATVKSAPPASAPAAPEAQAPLPLPFPQKRTIVGRFDGLAIQVNWADGARERYGRLIRETAALGASCVLLSVNAYQERVESLDLQVKPEECPPDEVWRELFDLAHAAGMKVVLMPKVLLNQPNGKWRGKIAPPSWDAWFVQYGKYVRHFAELAETGRVEMFIVGSELISSEKYTENWKALIRDTRQVFTGLLAYSANWDHYTGIQFWDDLDVVGLTTYHQLADDPDPTVEELCDAWEPLREKILSWRATVDRPILFTEVGWCSQEGCSIEPWNYYHQEEATPAGHEEQRRNYEAFVKTWADQPGVVGMVWWEWTDAPGGPDDHGYTPRGKPAEAVLRELFKRPTTEDSASRGRRLNCPSM